MSRISSRSSNPGRPTRRRHGPYRTTGYVQFLDHEGYSGDQAALGVLNAINLNTGEFAWRVPLGEHAELTARGVPRTGTETFGGSIVTAGGLVFIAGTKDERIHAFDKQTGQLLWEHPLPAGGYATPSTYQVNGRQYVVIAAGGAGKLRTKAGDAFVAFASARRVIDRAAVSAGVIYPGEARRHYEPEVSARAFRRGHQCTSGRFGLV